MKLDIYTQPEYQLLSSLIGKKEHDIAINLLQSCDFRLDKLQNMSYTQLINSNVTKSAAIRILSAFELVKRSYCCNFTDTTIKSSTEAYNYLKPHFFNLQHEQFKVLLLNRSSKIIKVVEISTGGVSHTLVDAKLVFYEAINNLSSQIILAHNHPSGNISPSKDDIRLTKKLVTAASNLDIVISDHLIITNNNYYSFADECNL